MRADKGLREMAISELDPERYYGTIPAPEGMEAYEWGMTCCADDCEAHAYMRRPLGGLIKDSRARELLLRNGWSRLGVGKYACPLHSIRAGGD